MGSRSQNPRGTRVPAKKSVDPVKTPKKPHPKSKVSALLDFFSDLKHTYCRHYFGSISTLLQLFRKFKFLTSNHFVIPFKLAAAKKSVCSLRLNGRKGIQPLVTYDKVFCDEKLYRLTFKRHEVAFFIRLRCACWIFELEKANYPCFFGDKSDSVWLDEKQHGGTKQWTPWKKFDIPTTWNCKRITANCSLRFPMENLTLKVSTEHHVTANGKREFAPRDQNKYSDILFSHRLEL